MKADRMIALRESRGMSQQELADMVGMSKQQIWRYENEISDPTIDTAQKIAKVLECSLEYLVGGTGKADYLTGEEMRLLDAYRLMKLSPDERRWLRAFREDDPALVADLLATFMTRLSDQLKDRDDISGSETDPHQ